jgi:hypothetical protein
MLDQRDLRIVYNGQNRIGNIKSNLNAAHSQLQTLPIKT